ncbi:hypothetical protein KEJ45_00225 [Candidatus Bathyarchaeota archaeon]|nr:hypothetical protein [Candidatus Bathyarchaeota archaeon]
MKVKQPFLHDKNSPKRRNDLIGALETIESREKVQIKIVISYDTAETLRNFLKEKGLLEGQGIPMLIQYGLSSECEEELDKLKSEMKSKTAQKLWGRIRRYKV